MNAARLTLDTLRFTGGADRERQRSRWAETDARPLTKLVEFEGCDLWLWRRVSELGIGTPRSPFFEWLERRARAIVAHNLLVDVQADRVARLLYAHGVPFVFIKGIARRALAKEIPFADARVVRDVDVLVPAAYAYNAWEHLRGAGYERIPPVRNPAPFHLPPVFDRDGVLVELHTSTSRTVAPDEAWHRAVVQARRVTRAGVAVQVQASPTELLWHAITHALNHHPSSFRLRLLLDGAVICAAGVDVDWNEIGRRLDSQELDKPRYAVRWLGAAAWLAGTRLPTQIARRAPAFDLGLALSLRMAVLRRIRINRALCPMLMDGVIRAVIATRPTFVRRRRKIRVN